nr:type I restriction endonuclease [Limisphaera ngatamarikiensis]
MKPTDTSEAGLETLICRVLTGSDCTPRAAGSPAVVAETAAPYGGMGWLPGDPADYDREYCVDLVQLAAFLRATQPKVAAALDLDQDSPTRRKFLARLQGEVSKRGVVDVLRNGIQHGPHRIELFFGTPSPGNEYARALHEQNRFTVTRQLRYSRDERQRALDLVLFINGLPVFTFELKNRLTKQTVHDAIEQYKRDRNPREKLFDWDGVWRTSPWTTTRCGSARTFRARRRGFCRSTRDGTTARAIPPIRAGSRPTTCGGRSSPARA